jgi:uncharacterized protein
LKPPCHAVARLFAAGKLPRRRSLCKSPARPPGGRLAGERRATNDMLTIPCLIGDLPVPVPGRSEEGAVRYLRCWPQICALLIFCVTPAAVAGKAAAQKHFFWKVTGDKGVVFLLGTIHVGNAALYPLPAPIEDSFRHSDTLVEEIDVNAGGEMQALSQAAILHGTYPSGDSIANHIGEKTLARLTEYVKTNPIGSDYLRLKPWLLGMLIDAREIKRLGLDGSKGLDTHFQQEATQLHKPIGALETADFQLRIMMSFPDELQDQLLLTSLLEAAKGRDTIDRMMSAWIAGSPQAMEDVITAEVREYPALQAVMEKVLYERNDAMTQKIEQFLKTEKSYFVAVGAGHLVGERGILNQLRAKNYTVEQL